MIRVRGFEYRWSDLKSGAWVKDRHPTQLYVVDQTMRGNLDAVATIRIFMTNIISGRLIGVWSQVGIDTSKLPSDRSVTAWHKASLRYAVPHKIIFKLGFVH